MNSAFFAQSDSTKNKKSKYTQQETCSTEQVHIGLMVVIAAGKAVGSDPVYFIVCLNPLLFDLEREGGN